MYHTSIYHIIVRLCYCAFKHTTLFFILNFLDFLVANILIKYIIKSWINSFLYTVKIFRVCHGSLKCFKAIFLVIWLFPYCSFCGNWRFQWCYYSCIMKLQKKMANSRLIKNGQKLIRNCMSNRTRWLDWAYNIKIFW